MDQLNNKVTATQDEVKFTAQNVGLYGFDSTTQGGKWRRVNADPSGQLHVAVAQHLVDSPDLKARTDIADPATSTFLKCNTDGTLEMTAELSTAGLATEAKQNTGNNTLASIDNKIILPSVLNSDQLKVNDSAVVGSLAVLNNNITTGNQASKSMGNNSGSDVQIKVDAAGIQEVSGTVSTTISGVSTEAKQDTVIARIATTNSTLGDTNSKIDAMRASDSLTTVKGEITSLRTDTTDGSAKAKIMGLFSGGQYQVATDGDGHLQVDVLSGGGGGTQFAGEATLASTGTGTAMIGRDNTGTARLAAMDTSGNLQIDIVANSDTTKATSTLQTSGNTTLTSIDGKVATETTLAAVEAHQGNIENNLSSIQSTVSSNKLQVDVITQPTRTTASPDILYTGGSLVIASGGSAFQDFNSGTIGGATFNPLNVDGLGDVTYIIEGVGTAPQLTISELVGGTAGSLFVNSAQQFAFNNDDFAVTMTGGVARHRGLRITNTSGANSYTVNKITALYHTP